MLVSFTLLSHVVYVALARVGNTLGGTGALLIAIDHHTGVHGCKNRKCD